MNSEEYLLIVAMEESAELAQEISKGLRFGMDNYHPDAINQMPNTYRIIHEFYQLQSVIRRLQETGTLPSVSGDMAANLWSDKTNKVERYAEI